MPYGSFNELATDNESPQPVAGLHLFNPDLPTNNGGFDVTSNPNGTVSSGAVQPPAPAQQATNPPPKVQPTVQSLDQRVTALEKKVDDGFAEIRETAVTKAELKAVETIVTEIKQAMTGK